MQAAEAITGLHWHTVHSKLLLALIASLLSPFKLLRKTGTFQPGGEGGGEEYHHGRRVFSPFPADCWWILNSEGCSPKRLSCPYLTLFSKDLDSLVNLVKALSF